MKVPVRREKEETPAEVRMLPPNYAIYLKEVVFAPLFVKLGPSITIFVPPLLLAESIHRIIWDLVLLKDPLSQDRVEFAPPWLDLKEPEPGREKLPQTSLWQLSPTQVCLDVEPGSPARGALKHDYNIHFDVIRRGRIWRKVLAKMKADPTVLVTSDPLEIPTYP